MLSLRIRKLEFKMRKKARCGLIDHKLGNKNYFYII